MNTYPSGLGIRFNDCFFGEPVPLDRWTPPRSPGLYVILAADTNWAPKPFRPLYFGEFGNNAKLPVFGREAGQPAGKIGEVLFAAALEMPFSTTAQRCLLRNELIAAYNPPGCVLAADTPQSELARRLDELELRHQREAAELRMLFAGAYTYPVQQPQPRRRIGFIPLSQTA
jgi:hypothetical protein